MKLKSGDRAPHFSMPSHLDTEVSLASLLGKKHIILAFFPMAWTPIWTNQIPSYEAELARFDGCSAQVLGVSIDHIPCLKAWAKSLGGISFPLLSDFNPFGAMAAAYGVKRDEGFSERAIFIIDRDGIIRYIDIHDISDKPKNDLLFAEIAKVCA
jgi:peroxiredoxin